MVVIGSDEGMTRIRADILVNISPEGTFASFSSSSCGCVASHLLLLKYISIQQYVVGGCYYFLKGSSRHRQTIIDDIGKP